MLKNIDKNENKRFTTIDEKSELISVGLRTITHKGKITNYLINIEDYAGGLTVLLDKNGNSMFSQLVL